MELLLQAGIHLIKKVITFVIYERSVQVSKACTLFYFFSAEFFFSQIFLRGKVLSHRFHRYTQIFYGISVESLCQSQGGICNDRTGRLRENP